MQPEKPLLGGIAAVLVFIAVLLAFTIQSDLTTYVQSQLGFKQPYFLFYVAHSSFSFVFPVHLFYLIITTKKSSRQYMNDLFSVLRFQFAVPDANNPRPSFPISRLIRVCIMMFLGLTGPGLMWYVSVSLTSISDITALWNSNAFWAYVFTVKLYGLEWERRKLSAVLIAFIGVVAIVYGGVSGSEDLLSEAADSPVKFLSQSLKSPLLGNLLALMASIWYGLFQVIYKKVVALPNDPEVIHEGQETPSFARLSTSSSNILEENDLTGDNLSTLPGLPFGLHPNFFVSVVGLITIVIMASLFPVLHYLEVEKFMLPPDIRTSLCLACIATMGLVFNAGFMVLLVPVIENTLADSLQVLLGIWGPVITSVGGLLTIILVLFSDVLFVEGFGILTIWNLSGSLMIIGSFAMLATEFRTH